MGKQISPDEYPSFGEYTSESALFYDFDSSSSRLVRSSVNCLMLDFEAMLIHLEHKFSFNRHRVGILLHRNGAFVFVNSVTVSDLTYMGI